MERFRKEEFLFRWWPGDPPNIITLRLDSVGWKEELQRAMQTASNLRAQSEEKEKSKNLKPSQEPGMGPSRGEEDKVPEVSQSITWGPGENFGFYLE